MTFSQACEQARKRSLDGCVRHVQAIIELSRRTGEPEIAGYGVAEWCDSATVKSFVNGKEIER